MTDPLLIHLAGSQRIYDPSRAAIHSRGFTLESGDVFVRVMLTVL